jgi:hypothetical protein
MTKWQAGPYEAFSNKRASRRKNSQELLSKATLSIASWHPGPPRPSKTYDRAATTNLKKYFRQSWSVEPHRLPDRCESTTASRTRGPARRFGPALPCAPTSSHFPYLTICIPPRPWPSLIAAPRLLHPTLILLPTAQRDITRIQARLLRLAQAVIVSGFCSCPRLTRHLFHASSIEPRSPESPLHSLCLATRFALVRQRP